MMAKRLFRIVDLPGARMHFTVFVEYFETTAPRIIACLEEGLNHALVMLPWTYCGCLYATNRQRAAERGNPASGAVMHVPEHRVHPALDRGIC